VTRQILSERNPLVPPHIVLNASVTVSHVQPIVQQYESTAVQKKSVLIKVNTVVNMENFHCELEGRHPVPKPNQHFLLLVKVNGTQRRMLVSP